MSVTLRYWAAARAAAGCPQESTEPGPLTELLAQAAARHGEAFARLLSMSTVLVDGERVDRDSRAPVAAGALVEVLPPFAGG